MVFSSASDFCANNDCKNGSSCIIHPESLNYVCECAGTGVCGSLCEYGMYNI